MDEGEASRLKLIVQKGPLSGQAREFKPGTRVQIGRVKRNTLSIKDAGVSSKHLTFQFESGSNEWTVTDLNSSNGTVLNGESLQPSVPYTLSEGDVIKIGELTSIEVKISREEQKKGHSTRSRRNLRLPPVPDNGKNLGVIDENSELGLGFDEELGEKNEGKGVRRSGRLLKNEVKQSGDLGRESENLVRNMVRRTRSSMRAENSENVEEMGDAVNGKLNVRRTRSSKKVENLESDETLGSLGVEKVSSKRTRGAKNTEKVTNGVENVEATENVRVVEEKKGQGVNSKRTRKEERLGDGVLENDKEKGDTVGGKMSLRRTRSSKKVGDVENGEEMGNAVSGKMNMRRTRSSKKAEDLGSDEELSSRVAEKVISKSTRGAKKQGKVENGVEHVEAVENVRAVQEKKGQGVSSMRTRSSTKVENMGEIHCMSVQVGDLDFAVGRRTRNGMRARRNLGMEASESVDNGKTRGTEMVEKVNLGEGCEGDDGNSVKDRADRTEEEKNVNVGRKGDGGLPSTSGVKSNSVLLDLEKMTLGEWFDYLEEYLPKQIIEQTDAMILEMRQKAEKVNELLFQQKVAKEKR